MRDGKSESDATRIAIGRIEDWASGRGGVSPEVKAAAAKAIAEWEALRAKSHAQTAGKDAAKKLKESWLKFDAGRGHAGAEGHLRSAESLLRGAPPSPRYPKVSTAHADAMDDADSQMEFAKRSLSADHPAHEYIDKARKALSDADSGRALEHLGDARDALDVREAELREDWGAWDASHKLNWEKAPGGKRYEFHSGQHHLKIVKQNTAAGGPRWKAYHETPGVTKIVAKGDDFKQVRAQTESHWHGHGG